MDEYTISAPNETHYEAIGNFLFQDYLQRERCCVTSGLSAEMAEAGLDLTSNTVDEIIGALQEGLTLIAADSKDPGTIVGVAINVKAKDDTEFDSSKLSKSRQAIIKFVKQLKEGHDITTECGGQGFYLWMLGVREIHCRKGIARRLTEKSIELARQKNMSFISSIASCAETVHLCENMGFETKSEMKFQDFFLDNHMPGFPHATSLDKARFTVKKL
ncbi:uncharacterized protein LOC130692488 [Daphnia carinata]|uniref:uncharacterized protein LOC130692488 n=1 Tax=Daphnia carinata TaxID=120202 RepID=UPI00257CB0F4|nr:uncharacterized protein LOC130692488 [Daphnia carinata]